MDFMPAGLYSVEREADLCGRQAPQKHRASAGKAICPQNNNKAPALRNQRCGSGQVTYEILRGEGGTGVDFDPGSAHPSSRSHQSRRGRNTGLILFRTVRPVYTELILAAARFIHLFISLPCRYLLRRPKPQLLDCEKLYEIEPLPGKGA